MNYPSHTARWPNGEPDMSGKGSRGMNCKQVDKLLIMHLYGDLTGEVGRRIQEHVRHCEACGARFETYRGNSTEIISLRGQTPSRPLAAAAIDTWWNERMPHARQMST